MHSFVLSFIGAAFLIHLILWLKASAAEREAEERKYGAHWETDGRPRDKLHWSERQALEMKEREDRARAIFLGSMMARHRRRRRRGW